MALITQIYKPVGGLTGQLYARPYGSTAALKPVGNCLELTLTHTEEVRRQMDMTRNGGGTYARFTRITQAMAAMKLGDWNPVNFTRAVLGTVGVVAAGALTDVSYAGVKQGGLVRLARPSPSAVTVKIASSTITPTGNYEVRPEGIFILPGAPGIADDATLLISSTHPEHVNVEALTTTAPELELSYGGLNEADSGKPVIVDIWRVSSSVVKQLALVQSDFAPLDIETEILVDPNRTGVGISRFYRAQMV